MSHAKNKIRWCINKAQKELKQSGKHRGLIEVGSNINKARKYIEKAEHNLRTTIYLKNGGYTDWCSSTLFYTIYHCFLAIAIKFGYESRNQECTFALIQSLIEDGKINFDMKDIAKIYSLDIDEKHHTETITNIREEYQYSTKLSLKDKTLEEFVELSRKILDETKIIIES